MGRFERSLSLFKSSWGVVRADKELLLLPAISGVVSVVVMASFAFPAWFSLDHRTTFDSLGQTKDTLAPTPLTYVIGIAFYIVSAFVVICFNSALICGANERFEGGDPTVGSALAGARQRIGLIFQWALVSATVSMIIRQIQERGGLLGKILGGVLGFAWAVVTYLVLPLLVLEGVGVGEALRRSKEAVRTTWGENLIGQGGLSIIGFVATLPGIAIGVLGVMAFQTSAALGVELIALGVLVILGVAVLMSAMGVVYQTALYRFATQRPVVGYDTAALSGAFRAKGARGSSW